MAQDDLGRLLLGAFRAFEVEVNEALDERELGGLRPSFAAVFVHAEPGGIQLSDLARRASMSKQGMADIVREMQELGLVRRAADPDDGRGRLVVVTAKGRRYLAQASRAIERVEGRVRRRLGERRYELLRSALSELTSETA
ncbi:MAG: MarR family transcriptional regulator [Actinobacteria bacterium]|nr:MarR family transcriptional regulator [Actinomycetota bacterium]